MQHYFVCCIRLDENYELVAGACLPRSVLYTHYQDFCKKNQLEASSAASFGKVDGCSIYCCNTASITSGQAASTSLLFGDVIAVCISFGIQLLYPD